MKLRDPKRNRMRINMYKSIVKRRVRSLYTAANSGNWQAIVDALGPIFS
jgi:hypothetical protein